MVKNQGRPITRACEGEVGHGGVERYLVRLRGESRDADLAEGDGRALAGLSHSSPSMVLTARKSVALGPEPAGGHSEDGDRPGLPAPASAGKHSHWETPSCRTTARMAFAPDSDTSILTWWAAGSCL